MTEPSGSTNSASMFSNAQDLDVRQSTFNEIAGNSYVNNIYYGSPNFISGPVSTNSGNSAPGILQPAEGQGNAARNSVGSNAPLNVQEDVEHGLNLLSLDGGGIRGLSELLILEEIMERIMFDLKLDEIPRPCDYFDLIGGTSTGGLVALMLGRLRMSTSQAIRQYSKLANSVFSEKKWVHQDGLFKAKKLEEAIKDTVHSSSSSVNPSEPMFDPRPSHRVCKTFVCAVPAHHIAGAAGPRLFRTYQVRENNSYNCAIWEAARATSAAPTFFKRIKIGVSGSQEEFIDAGLGCNNPVKQVHEEAESIWRSRSVACVVSIGAGHSKTISLQSPGALQRLVPTDLIKVLKGIATDCEKAAEEYRRQHSSGYFRFNVEDGMQNVSLEEWKKLGEVTTFTKQYLNMSGVKENVDAVVKILCKRHCS